MAKVSREKQDSRDGFRKKGALDRGLEGDMVGLRHSSLGRKDKPGGEMCRGSDGPEGSAINGETVHGREHTTQGALSAREDKGQHPGQEEQRKEILPPSQLGTEEL